MSTIVSSPVVLFDQQRQRKYLVWSCGMIALSGVIFAMTLPLMAWYYNNYAIYNNSSSDYVSDDTQYFVMIARILLTASATFLFTCISILLLHCTVKLFFNKRLAMQPRMQVCIQYAFGVTMCAIALLACAVAIFDPHGWGVIGGIIIGPLAAIHVIGLLITGIIVGGSQVRKYRTSLYQTIPILALVIIVGFMYISGICYGYASDFIDERNAAHQP